MSRDREPMGVGAGLWEKEGEPMGDWGGAEAGEPIGVGGRALRGGP